MLWSVYGSVRLYQTTGTQEIEINHHPVEYCLTVATHYSNHVIQSPHSINLPHTCSHMNAVCIAHVHTSD